MTTNSLYLRSTETSINITSTYQNILTGVPIGVYNLYLIVDSSIVTMLKLMLADNDKAAHLLKFNNGASLGNFSNNTLTVPLYNLYNSYTLIFKYLSGTLSVKLDTENTLTGVTFILRNESVVNPGANIIPVDKLQEIKSGQGITVSHNLKMLGGLSRGITTITNSTTLNSNHDFVICNPSSIITVTLPLSSDNPGKKYSILNKTLFAVTVTVSGQDTLIIGSSIVTSTILADRIILTNDGT